MPLPPYVLSETITRYRLNPEKTRNAFREVIDDYDAITPKVYNAMIDLNRSGIQFQGPGGVVVATYIGFTDYYQYEQQSGCLVRVITDINQFDRITWNGKNYRVVYVDDASRVQDSIEFGLNFETGGN